MDSGSASPFGKGTYELGSRQPLEVADLPMPEEVFGVRRLGSKEIVKFVLGPSLVSLGVAIGSGEWLLGPLSVGSLGFVGVGWVITISTVLQTFYNIEFARYVVATGEVPIVGFGRVPPGSWFWEPFSLLILFFAFIWGGWAKGAAEGLFALLNGRIPGEADSGTVELFAVLLLGIVFVIALASRKVTRGLELFNLTLITVQLAFLLIVDLLVVPFHVWWEALRGLLTPALPPQGSDATLLGGLAGFTALASGLNWFALNHYRDHGYGMGHRMGFIAGLRGERQEIRSIGITFPNDEKNAALWNRWMGFLKLDMWMVFFGGAMIGMFLCIVLMQQMVRLSGQKPTEENIVTFVPNILGQQHGPWLFFIALFVGFLILFDTQLGIFELLVRNMTDAVNTNPRFQRLIGGDPRRFYCLFMLVLTITIAIVLHFFQPGRLILLSANTANFGALIFPFMLMYMNSKLPQPARPRWPAYLLLLANTLFFGFFFINFVFNEITHKALVRF
jgi:hypothetical protein